MDCILCSLFSIQLSHDPSSLSSSDVFMWFLLSIAFGLQMGVNK